jgi:hypothetical protein
MWQFHKKVHYKYCRIYLIATMLLSVVIPAMNVPIYANMPLLSQHSIKHTSSVTSDGSVVEQITETSRAQLEPTVFMEPVAISNETASETKSKKPDWNSVIMIIYFGFIGITLLLTIKSLVTIKRLRDGAKIVELQGFILAKNEKVKTPFTFFRTIFVGIDYSESEWRQIISHESSHARHLHSAERIIMTLLRTVFWFNPVMWIAEKRLEEVQEWQADSDAIGEGFAIDEYRKTILHQIFGNNPNLSLGMCNSFTKNRFIMMTQKLNRKCTRPAVLAVAVAAAAFFAFGCSNQTFANVTNNSHDTMTFDTKKQYNVGGEQTSNHIFFDFDQFANNPNRRLRTRFQQVEVGDKSIDTYEGYINGKKVSIAAANGTSIVRDPNSEELNWIDENTTIFVEGKLTSLADFKSMEADKIMCIEYLHLNSDLDFVYVRTGGYMSYLNDVRIFNPKSTNTETGFNAKLPDVVPTAGYAWMSMNPEDNHMALRLHETKTDKYYDLIVPTQNLYFDGRFGDFAEMIKWKDNISYREHSLGITLYHRAAAKRFGNKYDYVIEFFLAPPDTAQIASDTEEIKRRQDAYAAADTTITDNLRRFPVSFTGGNVSDINKFKVILNKGEKYQIFTTYNGEASRTKEISAMLTDAEGNICGRQVPFISRKNEVIIFDCQKTGNYTISVYSKYGEETTGLCALRLVRKEE